MKISRFASPAWGRLQIARFAGLLILVVLSACQEGAHGEPEGQSVGQPDAQAVALRRDLPGSDRLRGAQLIVEYGCASCHKVPGIREADNDVGPPLTDWADRQYIAGALTNTPENLIYWIRFPQAVEPGTVMPDAGVTEEDARDIAAYLYTLSDEEEYSQIFETPRAFLGGLFSPAEETPESAGTGEQIPETGSQEGSSLQEGREIYNVICAHCHQPDGQGVQGQYPPLAGSALVTQPDPAPLIQTVLFGRRQMPGFISAFSDGQVAAVVSYIRSAWGNDAPGVTPEQVQQQKGPNPPTPFP